MAMIESGIQMVVSALDKRKRRFVARLLATGAIDNSLERDKQERTTEEIFQLIVEWCLEDYRVEEIRYSMENEPIGIGQLMRDGGDTMKEKAYNVVIYTDRSTQMPETGFQMDNQRAETEHAAVIMTRPSKKDEMKILDVRRGLCRGREGNFDTEVRAIREAVM